MGSGPGLQFPSVAIRLPALTALGGFAAGALLGLLFNYLHGNWDHLGWTTPDARSTAPFWTAQVLAPVVVAAGWTALVLHARSVVRWVTLAGAAFAAELVLFLVGWFPIAVSGNGGVAINTVAWLLLVLAVLAALPAAFVWRGAGPVREPVWHLAAGLALPVALLAGYVLGGGPAL